MRLQTRIFLVLSGFALLLWVGALWAIQSTLQANFSSLSNQALSKTRLSVHAMQDERVKRMRLASSLVMNSPELRALIAEHNYEFSPDNLASLEERLDGLARMLDAGFVCVLDDHGIAIAQSRGFAWADIASLRSYLSKTSQAKALVRSVFVNDAASPGRNYGLWVVNGRLMQMVGVPLIFETGTAPEGALLVAAPITDELAVELAADHGCELTFLTGGTVAASSIAAPELRAQLPALAGAGFGTEAVIGGVEYLLSTEKLIDPCSGQEVGDILIQSNQADALAVQARVRRTLQAILLGGLLIVAVVSFLLSAAITRPVAELLGGVRRVAGGDLSLRLPARRDELGALASAFNDMVTQLGARRELERQIEESRAASRAKSQFLANMSHEIRTPLNGVIGMAELLLGTALTDRQQRYATLVKSSAEVLTTLINDALDFAKIESGKIELESIDFDLHTVVEDVVEIFAPKGIKKGLGIACDIHGDTPLTARGDPNRLRQVLTNLLNNAVKFTERGEIVVTMCPEPGADSVVNISVTDSGVGIPKDRLDRLFRAFSQVDASTTRRFGGTGLGLVISKQLVELMGGKIGVETHEGRGSRFWFTVKLAAADDLVPLPTARVEPVGAKVLVASCDATTRRILANRLRERGANVVEAGTMAEISEAIRTADNELRFAFVGKVSADQNALQCASAVAAQLGKMDAEVFCVVSADLELTPDQIAANGLRGCITIPLRRVQLNGVLGGSNRQTAGAAADVTVAGKSELRILVADDHEVNQLLVVDMLEQAGLKCDAVSDGAQAVKAAVSGKYDVILMDCQMPVMDGFDAVREIRVCEKSAGQGGKRVHIIALTANASEADRQRCLDAGMDDYCSKPVKREGLLRAILGTKAGLAPAETSEKRLDAKSFDLQALLGRCSGKPALAEKIVGMLLARAQESLEKIEAAFATADAAEVARIAHGLKGTAGMASAENLQTVAGKLEQLAKGGDLTGAADLIACLQGEVRSCGEFVEIALKQLSAMSRVEPASIAKLSPEYDHASDNS